MPQRQRDVLGQKVALQLEAAIIAGKVEAGTRLDEASLAERYQVSRTPVREALQILVSRALVTRMPYRGTVVSEITRERISELFEAMACAMRLKLAPFRRRQLADQARILRSHKEHSQIVEAILQRNGAAADKALRRHLTSAAKAMLVHWQAEARVSRAPSKAS